MIRGMNGSERNLYIGVLFIHEGDYWIAQGIDFDLAAQGSSFENAKRAFELAFFGQLQLDRRFGRTPLENLGPAPRQFRDIFDRIAKGTRLTAETLGAPENMPELPPAFMIQAVSELGSTPYAPFWQAGHVTGYVVLVGNRTGKTSAVGRTRSFVHLEGAAIYHCSAKRSVAMELRKYLLTDTPLRCSGQGRWERGADARWTLLEFDIERYEALKSKPLAEIMEELGQVKARWTENPNPLDLLADDDSDDTGGTRLRPTEGGRR